MTPHLLYFPCRDAVFDWFGHASGSGVAPVSVELLAEQREFESLSANRLKRVSCYGCEHPEARYVVCCRRGKTKDKLFPRCFPNSRHSHKPGCISWAAELSPLGAGVGDTGPKIVGASGDFAALKRELHDPEFSIVAMRRHNRSPYIKNSDDHGRGSARLTIGLQRLARELLQRSGVCLWRPQFADKRTEPVFNGLIKGALDALAGENDGPGAAILRSLPGIQFVPWSYLAPSVLKTPASMTKCVGFGFIESLGAENEHGARRMTLRNYPQCPVVVPRRILDREGRNPNSAMLSFLAHPTWVIFVTGLYGGIWKVHTLATFRVSETGLIPVDSHQEELLVHHLIERKREFKRLLLPPPSLAGSRFIPDFQLLDTSALHFIEVAGLMRDSDYAATIARKRRLLGDRLLAWDTRIPLHAFALPG